MANARQEARLNLVLSATDEASKIIEEFAAKAKAQFENFAKILGEALNPDQLAKPVAEGVNLINEELNRVNLSGLNKEISAIKEEVDSVFNSMQEKVASVVNNVKNEFSKIPEAISSDMQKAQEEIGKVKEEIAGLGAAGKKSFDEMAAGFALESMGKQVLGFFVSSAKAAADFDQDIHNVMASFEALGDSAIKKPEQSFNALKQKALELGSSGFFSANEIAHAMNTMAQQGISSSQILHGAIDAVANVAAANQQNIEQTATVVSDILRQYGDELKSEFGKNLQDQMGHVADALTKSLHSGKMSMQDFLNTMRYAGPQAAGLGIKFHELAGAIATLARHGIKGSQAGTALRRMFTNLIPQTKEQKAMFDQLGFTVHGANNVFLNHGKTLKSLPEIQKILHDRLSKLSPAMQQMALKTIFGQYALSGMTAIVRESPKDFQQMVESMKKAGATDDALKEKKKGLGFQIQHLKANFETLRKEIGDALKPVLTGLLGIVNGLISLWRQIPGPIRTAIVTFLAVGSALATVVGAFMVFKATLAMLPAGLGPWGLVITAIITGVVLIITHWKEITKWAKQFFGVDIPNAFNQFKAFVNAVWTQIVFYFVMAWEGIKKAAIDAWNYVSNAIMNGIKEVEKWWNDTWTGIKEFFRTVWDLIKAFATFYINLLTTVISGALNFIMNIWNNIWNAIGGYYKIVWDAIVNSMKTYWDFIKGIFQVALDLLTGKWSKAWDDMKNMLHNVWNDINHTIGTLINDALDWGKNLIKMLADGIESGIHWVENAVSNVASKIKSFLGFHSPTEQGPAQDSDTWSPNFMRMFAEGIENHHDLVEMAVQHVAQTMHDRLSAAKFFAKVKALVHTQELISRVMPAISKPTLESPMEPRINNVSGYVRDIQLMHTLYERRMGYGHHHVTVNIQIDGRSKETDKQLLDALQDRLARQFRTHLSMQTSV